MWPVLNQLIPQGSEQQPIQHAALGSILKSDGAAILVCSLCDRSFSLLTPVPGTGLWNRLRSLDLS